MSVISTEFAQYQNIKSNLQSLKLRNDSLHLAKDKNLWSYSSILLCVFIV
jgi:hypothetical protein